MRAIEIKRVTDCPMYQWTDQRDGQIDRRTGDRLTDSWTDRRDGRTGCLIMIIVCIHTKKVAQSYRWARLTTLYNYSITIRIERKGIEGHFGGRDLKKYFFFFQRAPPKKGAQEMPVARIRSQTSDTEKSYETMSCRQHVIVCVHLCYSLKQFLWHR